MYNSVITPRKTTRQEKAAGKVLLNLWLDGVSVNFRLSSAMFAALEQWRDKREIWNRTHAVRIMIAGVFPEYRDPYEPGLLKRLDDWRLGNEIGTRTRAVRAIIQQNVMPGEPEPLRPVRKRERAVGGTRIKKFHLTRSVSKR